MKTSRKSRRVGESKSRRFVSRIAGESGSRRKKSPALRLSGSPIHTKSFAQRAGLAIALLGLVLAAPGCAYYSFTGATIPANLNTVAIPLVEDNSLSPLTTLDEELTELLITRFVRQTRLTLETNEDAADIILTARIDRYTNAPTSVSGQERAEFNRVGLTVSVRYYNRVEDEELFDRSFNSFDDYDPLSGDLEDEENAARNALENIADDIFTAATSNW